MLMALTREISAAFEECQLTHAARVPIDLDRARAQHADYEWALVEAGCTVRRLDSGPHLPDSVFVEDIAIVFSEGAVITRPGAEARRAETPVVAEALARHGLPQRPIQAPGTVDGGDVLVIGRRVFVGSSSRTNAAGIEQMVRILSPLDYIVRAVPVRGCLHLKSAATVVADDTVLINRAWVAAEAFAGLTLIDVHPDEPRAANALLVRGVLIYPTEFPKTGKRLESRGLKVRAVEVGELAKAEGGVTCCSLIFEM